jgi:hypothetical protein
MRREEKVERDRTRASACLLLAVFAAGCVATPLPTPPSANADRMELVASQTGQVSLSGAPGAIRPGGILLRVSSSWGRVDTAVAGDGRFAAALDGRRTDVFELEALTGAEPLFLLALTGGEGDAVVVVDAPDPADGDGADPAGGNDDPAGGNDDPAGGNGDPAGGNGDPAGGNDDPAGGDPNDLVELCNGVDDDLDGAVDEGCGNDPANQCRTDDDCSNGLSCTNGVCGA